MVLSSSVSTFQIDVIMCPFVVLVEMMKHN